MKENIKSPRHCRWSVYSPHKGPISRKTFPFNDFIMKLFYLSCMFSRVLIYLINTLRPRQNGRHFPDDIFKWIFVNENAWISINISLKFVPRGPISHIPALVQMMAWRWPGDKPLSEPMMVILPTHICATRPTRSWACYEMKPWSIRRRLFQMHFLEWKYLFFNSFFTQVCF